MRKRVAFLHQVYDLYKVVTKTKYNPYIDLTVEGNGKNVKCKYIDLTV